MSRIFLILNAVVFCVFVAIGAYWFAVGNKDAGVNAFCVCAVIIAWYLQMRRPTSDVADQPPIP